MPSLRGLLGRATFLASLAPLAAAHSWVEEYQVILPNGSFVGERGYSRGYVSREDPTFNGFSMLWLLPALDARNQDGTTRTRISNDDFLCHPAQRTSNYSATYPKLNVQPGDYVAMKYLENGHVSLPWNITGKPAGTGTVFIFGTTNPSATEKIAEVMKWNKDSTGGNKRGFLMTAQNFDDGRCHQINCGSISQQRQMLLPNHVADQPTSTVESWCETDLKIPETVKPGTLTTYWVWQWPTEPNVDCNTPAGKDEYYTTCADFNVVGDDSTGAAGGNHKRSLAPFSAPPGANPQSVAVSDFKSRTADLATPSTVLEQHNKLLGSLPTAASAFVNSCSQQASVISANSLTLWPEVYVPNSCSVISSFGKAAATAAAAEFAKAASSYALGSSSAWSAAFAAAHLPSPTPVPWSQVPNVDLHPTSGAASPASPEPTSITPPAAMTSPLAPYTNSTRTFSAHSIDVTTITTVVVVTSILPAGQAAPTSSSTAPSPPPSTDSFVNTYGLSTIMTVPASSSSSDVAPVIPSVGSNGAVYRRERPHARHFRHA